MDKTRFNLWNRIVAAVVFVIAAVTYLSTIEPTASFWDCGEFIASSYKLEVGHPPGNPVFQLFARIFTIPVPPEKAAVTVNAMNGILSALTVFFLYLTTVFFAKRLVRFPVKPGMTSVVMPDLIGHLLPSWTTVRPRMRPASAPCATSSSRSTRWDWMMICW